MLACALQVRSGATVASLPPEVLNNPAFSGKVANMLVTNTDPPEVPQCGEFQQLVGGEQGLLITHRVPIPFLLMLWLWLWLLVYCFEFSLG
jgi:hypothetical protein